MFIVSFFSFTIIEFEFELIFSLLLSFFPPTQICFHFRSPSFLSKIMCITKIYNFHGCDWCRKKLLFSTNSLAKLRVVIEQFVIRQFYI